MNIMEWLDQEGLPDRDNIEIIGVEKEVVVDTIFTELVRLVIINGGISVTGYGIKSTSGVYGRSGLTFMEVQRLLYLNGVIDGFMLSEDKVNEHEFFKKLKFAIDGKLEKK